MVLSLNNGLGRPKLITRYKSMFDFFQNHLLPEKDKLIRLQKEAVVKKKEWLKAEGKVNIQNQKVERAYEWLEHFKK